MSIIIRYILRELGVTFLFGFVALTCVLLLVLLVLRASEEHISLIYVWRIIPFAFADASYISLPIALLLAVTIFFSRMSGNNEVIALKALGVPPSTFLLPVFVIAFIASLIGVRIYEWAVTWGRPGITAVIYSNAEDMMIERLRKDHYFETKNKQLTIMVQGVDDQSRLIEPTIMLRKESATIEARTAQISIDSKADILKIKFVDMRVIRSTTRIIMPNEEITISLSDFIPSGKSNRPSDMGLPQINEEKKKAVEQMEQQRRIIAAHRTFGATMGSVDAWGTQQIKEAQARIRSLQSYVNRLSVEPPRRWATGFCCFFFVWIGAPLAIWMKKSDFFASFFACFLPILLFYYPLLIFGLNQAKDGTLPPMCVWTANVGAGLVGLWFLRQIHRY